MADRNEARPPVAPRGGQTSRAVARNSLANWVGMAVQFGVNFFLLAYVLKFFGEADWGLYRLSVTVTMAIAFLSLGLAGSIRRLAAERLAEGDWDGASDVASVVRTLLMAGAAIGFVAVIVLSTSLLGPLNVPDASRPAAARLILLMGGAAALHLVRVAYEGLLQARERYDLSNLVRIAEIVINGGIIVLAFELGWVRLEVLGWARLASAITALVLGALLVRRVLPDLRMSILRFRRKAARAALSFGAWIAVGMAARIVRDSLGEVIVAATASLSAVAVFSLPKLLCDYAVLRVVWGLSLSLWPVATRYMAAGEKGDLERLGRFAMRFTVMLTVGVLAVVLPYGATLVRTLKPELADAYGLLVLMMPLFALRALGVTMEHIVLGIGRARGVAMSQALGIALGIGFAWLTVEFTEWGLYGVAIGLFAPDAIRGVTYMPWRLSQQVRMRWGSLVLKGLLPRVLCGVVPVMASLGLQYAWPPTSLVVVVIQMALVAMTYPLAVLVVLDAEERQLLRGLVART